MAKTLIDGAPSTGMRGFVAAFIGLSVVTTVALLCVVFPRLGRTTSSLFYFSGIVNQQLDEFRDRVRKLDRKQIEGLFIDQIYQNASIARAKFRAIRVAIIC